MRRSAILVFEVKDGRLQWKLLSRQSKRDSIYEIQDCEGAQSEDDHHRL